MNPTYQYGLATMMMLTSNDTAPPASCARRITLAVVKTRWRCARGGITDWYTKNGRVAMVPERVAHRSSRPTIQPGPPATTGPRFRVPDVLAVGRAVAQATIRPQPAVVAGLLTADRYPATTMPTRWVVKPLTDLHSSSAPEQRQPALAEQGGAQEDPART